MGRIIQRKKSEGKKEDKINILKWSRDEWVKTVNVRLALYCVGWRQMKCNWSACKWMMITVISEVLNNFNCNVTFTIRVFCAPACKRRYHGNFNEPFRVLSMLKFFVYSLSSGLYRNLYNVCHICATAYQQCTTTTVVNGCEITKSQG